MTKKLVPVRAAEVPANTEGCPASIEGHRQRYLRCGSGPKLLLIHGLLGYSFSWRFNLAALSERATVYAPDLLGTGFSDRPAKLDCSLRAQANRMLLFMDQTGIEQADLLGTSHGGAVAMMLAGMAPRRVRRLVLVAPVNPWSRHGRLFAQVLGSGPGALLLRTIQPCLRPTHRYFLARMYGDPRRIAAGTVEGYSAALTIPGTAEYLLGVVRGWQEDLRELERALLSITNISTLLVWGDRDRAVPLESAEVLASRFLDARLLVIRGAGHLPYEECPGEFNQAVLGFLKLSPSPSAVPL